MTPIFVAFAGSLGAVCRFMLDGHIKARFSQDFPWATFIINVTGSLALGVVTGVLLSHKGFSSTATIIGAGFCGGYTTFSTASFETVRLLEKRRYAATLSNVGAGLGAAIIAAVIGLAIGQLI